MWSCCVRYAASPLARVRRVTVSLKMECRATSMPSQTAAWRQLPLF